MSTQTLYDHLEVFKKPKCLAKFSKDLLPEIQKDTLDEIRQIKEPLIVISVVGDYRTGKSYLLSRLGTFKQKEVPSKRQFPLKNTLVADTKGIWIWCRPHPWKNDRVIVLIDTEGLADVKIGTVEQDIWILSICLLVSSTFIYNQMVVINNTLMTKLRIVHELATQTGTRIKQNIMGSKILFLLTLRDFELILEEDGKEVSSTKYMETKFASLETKIARTTSVSKRLMQGSQIFPNRKCFTFVQPAYGDNLLRLDELTEDQLDETFLKQSNEFCEFTLAESEEKFLNNNDAMDGKGKLQLLEPINLLTSDSFMKEAGGKLHRDGSRKEDPGWG